MATKDESKITLDGYEIDYSGCIITPMSSEDGRPLVKLVHVVDASIVAGIVFFSLLLGTTLPAFFTGQTTYVGLDTIQNRLLTAALAFGLTFLAQWARYRGLKIKRVFNGDK